MNKYKLISITGHIEIIYGTSFVSRNIWNKEGWVADVPQGWLVIVERNVNKSEE